MSEPRDDRDLDFDDFDYVGWEPCDACVFGHGQIAVDMRVLCTSCYSAYLVSMGAMPHFPLGLS